MAIWRGLIGGAALLLGTALAATAQQGAGNLGQTVFQGKCAGCHSLGTNRTIGPGLSGVTTRRSRDWLTRWISAPDRMLAAGDSIAQRLLHESNGVAMPNLSLSPTDVSAVIGYLQSAGGGAGDTTTAAAGEAKAELPAGDPEAGKALFTGVVRLQNGGPPCIACHSIAGIGALGGGALGPDLSAAYGKYGDAGLAFVLASIPFPTMQPVFAGRSLTAREQADLRAFLGQAVAVRPRRAAAQLALFAVLGTLLLFGVVQVNWRRRLRGVRRPMIAAARSGSRPSGAGKR